LGAVTGFIPYAGCAYGAFDVLVFSIVDQVYDPNFGTDSYVASYLQTIGETAVGCYLDATTAGVGRVVLEVVDYALKAKSLYSYAEKCFTPEDKADSRGRFVSSRDSERQNRAWWSGKNGLVNYAADISLHDKI